jgi:hypothetical protein
MLVEPLLKQSERSVSKEAFDYLSVVGSLLHICNCVRCDVSYAVGVLARHATTPGLAHVKAAKRVVMYLYNTRTMGITYRCTEESKLSGPVLFEGTKRMLEVANERVEMQVEARCWCGSRATHNARVVNGVVVYEGETVVVGDTSDVATPMFGDVVRYELLCRRHYVRGDMGEAPIAD